MLVIDPETFQNIGCVNGAFRSTCADDIEDWDSLEQINLLTAIEKKFNIKFKLADVRGLKDVGDLLDLVARMV